MTARCKYRGTTHKVSDTNYWKRLNGVWRGLWQPETYRAYKAHAVHRRRLLGPTQI